MRYDARFFDGEIAMDHEVRADLEADALVFGSGDVAERRWPYGGLIAVDAPRPGLPFRLTHERARGTRFVIADQAAIAALVVRAPHLRGGINARKTGRVLGIAVGSIAAIALVAWLALTAAPRFLASILPESWRQSLGDTVEASFVEGSKTCGTAEGKAALDAFVSRLKQGNPDLPVFSLRVFDFGMVNAFALPGGRVVLSRQLIDAAESAEEVAGVLAHEIGHVHHRHPEEGMVRGMGLQVLLSLASGGGDTMGSMASILAVLRYSRDAEREADSYAREALVAGAIDPMGFKHFFETIRQMEGEPENGVFGKLGGILSTHPMTDERITAIQPLPPGVVARPVLTPAQWASLRAICGD